MPRRVSDRTTPVFTEPTSHCSACPKPPDGTPLLWPDGDLFYAGRTFLGGAPSEGGAPTALPGHRDEGRMKTFQGPLFVGRVEGRDVEQGDLANCFVTAGLASIAELRPQAIRQAFRNLPVGEDGARQFEVVLFTDGEPKAWPVDDRLLAGKDGRPVYGRWPVERGQELWFPLMEKALVDYLDVQSGGGGRGYASANQGGSSFVVFEAVLGARPLNYRLAAHQRQPEAVLELIERSLARREPMVAYTYDKGHADMYEGTGLVPWHTYAIFGTEAAPDGPRVVLYNPWSEGEPGDDGRDDGVFRLSMPDFLRYFRNMNVAHDPQVG